MKGYTLRAARVLPLAAALCCMAFAAREAAAQYQVYQWANFETGVLPPGTTLLGNNPERFIRIQDNNAPGQPPAGYREPIAARETGKYSLALRSDPQNWITGLAVGVILDRELLGARGRALYQADFFIPAEPAFMPNLAVLAMEPLAPGDTTPRSFYRFGLTRPKGSTGKRIFYFSHVVYDPTEQRQADYFVQDRDFPDQIPRPGWHRFSIIFEGQSTIRCYVDGRELSFSPIEHDTLKKLQVGILLADKDDAYECFLDNMSIQWTNEDVPLPDSPYAVSWGDAPPPTVGLMAAAQGLPSQGPAAAPQATAAAAAQPAASQGAILWHDTNSGWIEASASGKPMLVYFHAPRVRATAELNQIIQTDPAAQAFLRKVVPISVDVNQLQGGALARQFTVFRVPMLLLMNTEGKELARSQFTSGMKWADLVKPLPVQ